MEAPSVLTAPSRTHRLAEGRLALATRAATFMRFGGRWLCLLVTRCSPLPPPMAPAGAGDKAPGGCLAGVPWAG